MKIQFMKDAAKLVEIQELLVLSMLFNNNRAHTHKSRTHTQELLQPLNYSQSLSFSKIENNRFSMKIWLHIRYYQSVEPKSKKRIYNQAKKRQNSIKNVSVIEKKHYDIHGYRMNITEIPSTIRIETLNIKTSTQPQSQSSFIAISSPFFGLCELFPRIFFVSF